jgi:hypothetical protein
MKKVEAEGVKLAEDYNTVADDMTESEKNVADALLNNNLGSLTEEQIEAFKNGELSLEKAIGSSNYE